MADPLLVHVVVLADCTPIVPVGVAEILRKSAALPGRQRRQLDLRLVGPDLTVTTAGGLPLRCQERMADVRRSDLVVVPALDDSIDERLARNRAAVPWLRSLYDRGASVASACTGAFVLAEAGILDGRPATTHWAFQQLLRERYPKVRLQPHAILVDHGRVCTAGGATSFLNLALFLVERHLGAEVGRLASSMFLIDRNKAPQGAYAMFSTQKHHGDEGILRAQEIIEEELSDAPSVDEIARRVGISRRHFVRRFVLATGNTPRDYIRRVRVEAAKRALESGRDPVSAIAASAGYEDVVAFRRVFFRFTGLTPADYRSRYGTGVRGLYPGQPKGFSQSRRRTHMG